MPIRTTSLLTVDQTGSVKVLLEGPPPNPVETESGGGDLRVEAGRGEGVRERRFSISWMSDCEGGWKGIGSLRDMSEVLSMAITESLAMAITELGYGGHTDLRA